MRRVDLSDAQADPDPAKPEGFRHGRARLGPDLGAVATGATLFELPPGQAVCPYHYELGEEEWLLVLEGRATIRTPEGTEELATSELAFFPVGPDGAHQVSNAGDETIRVLMWSNVVLPTATVYPDSDKLGVYTRGADDDLIVERSSQVGYFHGEVGPARP